MIFSFITYDKGGSMFDLKRYEKLGKVKGMGYTTLGWTKPKRISYDVVGFKATRRDWCLVCEKLRSKTIIFSQEILPGVDRHEVLREEKRKALSYADEEFICRGCEK